MNEIKFLAYTYDAHIAEKVVTPLLIMMKKLFGRSEYFKNSFTLILGIGLAQTIPVLLQPILRRMYTPEEFGVFAVFFSIVSILAIVANYRYAHVVVIPEKDQTSKNVAAGALVLITITCIIIFLVLLFFGEAIFQKLGFPSELNKWSLLIPVSVFFVSGSLVLNSWLTRKKKFKSIASNKFLRRAGEGGSQVSFGYSKQSGGLIMGSIIGDALNFIVSFFQFKRAGGNFENVTKKEVVADLKCYKAFPKYNLLPTLLDTVSLFIPVFIITNFYSKEITGQFDLSRQILALPLALISVALSQVLLQSIAQRSKSKQEILPLLRKNFLALALMGVVGSLVLYAFSVQIFSFVFGDQWVLAGELTSVLVFSYALKFAISPLTITFIAIEKIKISSFWQVGYFGSMCILLTFDNMSIHDFIKFYVIIEIVAYSIYACLVYLVAKSHDQGLTKN